MTRKARTQSFTVKVTIPPQRTQADQDIAAFSESEILGALAVAFKSSMAFAGVTFEVEDNAAARRRRKATREAAAKARYEAHRRYALETLSHPSETIDPQANTNKENLS